MPLATTLFDFGFGTPDVFGAPGQRKVWFPRAIDIAQLPAALAARERNSVYGPEPEPENIVLPQLPIPNLPWETGFLEPSPFIRAVLPGSVGGGAAPVRRETVVVEGLPTEVERFPEGDFPAGSIFAPGRAWGGPAVADHGLDSPDPEETDVSIWGDLFSAGVDVLQGQYSMPSAQSYLGMSALPPAISRPSGAPALPPSAAPLQMTSTGDSCGNRRYVTLDRQTGKITCKRRRRRRLLTNRDLADLASLKTITGGGAALNAAVIKAVR